MIEWDNFLWDDSNEWLNARIEWDEWILIKNEMNEWCWWMNWMGGFFYTLVDTSGQSSKKWVFMVNFYKKVPAEKY